MNGLPLEGTPLYAYRERLPWPVWAVYRAMRTVAVGSAFAGFWVGGVLLSAVVLPIQGTGDDAYALKLTPTAPELKKMLASITIQGRGLEVSTLIVREANGDVSTTHFASVDTQKKYAIAEADRLFRVPPG